MQKKVIAALLVVFCYACTSTKGLVNIEPKQGTLTIPAKGELRTWQNVVHSAFTVQLTNPDATASVEVYKVKASGYEKWIAPSLQANKTLDVTIPANGHLFIKNFNDRAITINYSVN